MPKRVDHPIILGIVGDSASGKTTLSAGVAQILGADRCTVIRTDDYPKFDRAERAANGLSALDPRANYVDVLEHHLRLLRDGEPILKPVYDHTTGTLGRPAYVKPLEFVIAEGLLGYTTRSMRDCYDVKIYLDPEEELRVKWKIHRDTTRRGYTMEEVLKALRADWEGYEEMRQEFINAPKYGNDDDYADEIAKWTYSMIAEEATKVKDVNGASPMPSGLVVSRMFQLAPHTGALPNGRKLGDPLADGGISPHAGYDRSGPMAAILSASKIDSRRQKANIFNQKLTPASVAGEDGLRKFQNYIETAMHLGLDMIQFNIVDAATLRAAQEHPEEYANLVVRISGYNARFVELNKFVQDSVIERTEHALV